MEKSGDLIANGGFERGSEGWSWGQGLPEPGFVNREELWKGNASYVMGLTGVEGIRRIEETKNFFTGAATERLRAKPLGKASG